jgi:hypothetical protein
MRKLALSLVLSIAVTFVLTVTLTRTTRISAAPDTNAPQMSSRNYAINWSALGEISGGNSTSANYALHGTIGQMGANTNSSSRSYRACTGFQCVADVMRLNLPLILK